MFPEKALHLGSRFGLSSFFFLDAGIGSDLLLGIPLWCSHSIAQQKLPPASGSFLPL